MQAYLFVHFREKTTPDGEQVYFGVSRDGFHWEALNGGRPVLWAYYGDRGVRDFTITRSRLDGKFYIFATDLSLVLRNVRQVPSFLGGDRQEGEQKLFRLGIGKSDRLE